MTHDFRPPQKTTGLDTNAPAGKRSRFAPDPFPKPVQAKQEQPDLQTLIQRGLRLGDPMAKAWANVQPTVDSGSQQSVQAKQEQPDLQTLIQRGLRLGDPMAKAWANVQPTVQRETLPEEEKEENLQMKADEAVQRQELEEEENLQTKPESTIQPQELEEEDETLQTKAEPTLQRQELPEEEEDKTLQMQSEKAVQLKCQDCEQEQAEVQTKLTIGQPGDKYEQEADNMASQVMSIPDPTAENVQRQETEEEETLQQKHLADNITPVVQRQTSETQPQDSAGQNLESQLAAEKGGGSPLSDEVRGFMEPRFGADFSEVKVHTGSAAVQMNQQLGAQAFTHGNDIYYGKRKAPGNDALTAHELTHTIQQSSSQIQRQTSEKQESTSFWEWYNSSQGKEYQRLRKKLEAKGYKFHTKIAVGTKEDGTALWQKGFPNDDTLVTEVAWSISLPSGEWSWATTTNIVSKCQDWQYKYTSNDQDQSSSDTEDIMSIEVLDNPEEIKRRIAEIEQQISTQSLPDDEMLRLAEERDALWQKLQNFDESVIVEIPEPRVNVRIDSSSRRILVYVNNALVAEAETLSGQAGGLGVNSYWESSTKRLKMVMSTTPGVNVEFLHEKIEQLSPLLIEFGLDVVHYSQPVWLKTETVPEEFPVEANQSSQAALTNEPPEIVWSDVSEWVHGALDIAGLVPGVGEIADGINAGIYLAEGRYAEAAISAAAMIPVVGDAGKAGKWAVKGGKEVVETTARGSKEVVGGVLEAGTQKAARKEAASSIAARAKKLGYSDKVSPQKAPFNCHGQPVFKGKNGEFITRDVGHSRNNPNPTGDWKKFDRKGRRLGTYKEKERDGKLILKRVGD